MQPGFQSLIKKKLRILKFFCLLTFFVSLIFANGCSTDEHQSSDAFNADYSAYITGYTAGVISVESPFEVRFAHEVVDSTQIGKEVDKSLFEVSPPVSGKTFWEDEQTLSFQPTTPLDFGTKYQINLRLNQIIETPKDLDLFEFMVQTMKQNYSIELTGLAPVNVSDLSKQKLSGVFLTADVSDPEQVEKSFLAQQEGTKLAIDWAHGADRKQHRFTINNIKRGKHESSVDLKAIGDNLKVDKTYSEEVEIPALGDFKLMKSSVVQNPEQYFELQFSDPIDPDQNLDGLIHFSDEQTSIRFIVDENKVRAYPANRISGIKTVQIEPGIENTENDKFKARSSVDLSFEQLKPEVRLVGKGVIVPSTNGLVMPFEAVNLEAVDVTIIKIFESNISQFFQVNSIDGDSELQRVGRPVAHKKLSLKAAGVADLGKWNRFTLDLSELVQNEPGAIYQARISIRKKYSVFDCDQPKDDVAENELEIENDESIDEAWDSPYGSYSNYYPPNYRWEDRNNPCTDSYYTPDRNVSRNVFSSDLGMIVKEGKGGQVFITVNDLKTTDPIANVKVTLYDLQKKTIIEGKTDGKGWANLQPERKPFLLVAEKNGQKGYLKLDDGSSLSLSNFDVAGKEVQEGLKGFFYGERGVWRPGDSLFLSFMLEDKNKILPPSHPIIFELKDPQGNLVQHQVQQQNKAGLYVLKTKTVNTAPTGNWLASAQVGGATFSKRVKIETVKPNRLKINLNFGEKKFTVSNPRPTGNLKVQWLTGATARNLDANFELLLSRGKTNFPDFKNYDFEDDLRNFESETTNIFDAKINDVGEASVNFELPTESEAPGVLNATFIGKVFEEGGNFSIDQFTMPYYPFSSFVGVKVPTNDSPYEPLVTDQPHTVDVVVASPDGKPVERQNVNMELYKLDWRWWWDQSGDTGADYISNRYGKVLKKEKVKLVNGKGQWKFQVNEPDWGRFYVRACDPVSGHCAGDVVYVDWPGYAGRGDRQGAANAAMLTFTADKTKYNVGEKATITMPGSFAGKALVSIETGSKVLQTFWVDTKAGETSFPFEITKEMAPNIYVHVSLIQPHNQSANDLPIRMYGVIPVLVDDPQTHLEPEIQLANVLAPEEKISVEISEKNGKPMAYTLAMVDEGLLDITRFKTPAPWTEFYAREALGVKTWDLYDQVVGAYGGELERILSIGGDGELNNQGERKANRFKPVVKFLGPFTLEKGKTAKHVLEMPNYVGSVRTMVIAGYEGSYGEAEATTPVRKPLMILGTLPRVLGPDEEVDLPVNVFAMEDAVKNVSVNVKSNDLLTVQNGQNKSITFSETGDKMVDFSLKVAPTIGIGKVNIAATSGAEKAGFEVEIDVRNPNPPMTLVKDTILEKGKSWSVDYQPIGISGTNKATLEISNTPPIDLEKRLQYLVSYPHGCIEQTVSAAFPQLFLADVVNISTAQKAKIEENVKAAIQRITAFTTSEGGFAYWPSSDDTNEWGTSYAGHFLLEAQKKGYSIPNNMVTKWKGYQQRRASRWVSGVDYKKDDLVQAYRLYTLALANSGDQSAMNRLKEQKNLSLQGRWRLAAAYVLLGQPEAGKSLIQGQSKEVTAYNEMSYTFGSGLRDEAMILETLILLNQKAEGLDLMKTIAAALSNQDRWMSTQTTAYCLIAVSKFIGDQPKSGTVNFSYQANSASENVQSQLPVVQRTVAADGAKLQVRNNGEGVLYARLIQEGTPLAAKEVKIENGLQMTVTFKGLNNEPIDPETLVQGTDFIQEITVWNPGTRGNYQQLALTSIFPSGWEIINTRLNDLDQVNGQDQPKYQDIRDDRVLTYFDLGGGQRKTFKTILNASYTGKFYQPAIKCEAMYDHTISSTLPGKWVRVNDI